jgi:hypothetical protein
MSASNPPSRAVIAASPLFPIPIMLFLSHVPIIGTNLN